MTDPKRLALALATVATLAACAGPLGGPIQAPGAAPKRDVAHAAARYRLFDHAIECITEAETCTAALAVYNAGNEFLSHFDFNVVDDPTGGGDQGSVEVTLGGVVWSGTGLDVVIGPDVVSLTGTITDPAGNTQALVLDIDVGEGAFDALIGGTAYEGVEPVAVRTAPGSCELIETN